MCFIFGRKAGKQKLIGECLQALDETEKLCLERMHKGIFEGVFSQIWEILNEFYRLDGNFLLTNCLKLKF